MRLRHLSAALQLAGAAAFFAACAAGSTTQVQPINPALANPANPEMNQPAPATYQAEFQTTGGTFVIEVHRDWAPIGAERFYNLVRNGYYDGGRFFRVVPDFVAQFGIHSDPAITAIWKNAVIPDDPVGHTNARYTVTFGRSGPNSRAVQVFVNLADNRSLDDMGFAPFGEVVRGMNVIDRLYDDYGDSPPAGNGVDQARVLAEGEAYLRRSFPRLTRIVGARIVTP
jgi:peptidyl-prolyl cis-trans isomerase A (cyclophilin A)